MTDALPAPSSPIAYRDFRLYWVARLCASLATVAMVVVLGYQFYDIARTDYGLSIRDASFQLGLLGLAQFIPLAVMTPVAGWAADRFERRTVACISYGVDCLIALTLGALTYADALTLPMIYALAAMHGAARSFLGPAMSGIAPNTVPPAVLPNAIAMSTLAWQIASVAGPATGGLMFAARHDSPYWLSAGLLLVSGIALLMIRPIRPDHVPGHPVRKIIDGLKYTWNERFLLGAITLDLFAVLAAGVTALLPVYARDILHTGPEGLGWMRGAIAAGAVAVALWLSFRPLRTNVGVKMLWAVVVFGIATVGFGISQTLWLTLVFLAITGGADMLSVYVRGSLVQLNTPDSMRGRVSAVSGLAISASNELGEMQSGVAAALIGPVGAVVFGGTVAVGVTAIWAYIFPELRNARTFEPQYRNASP